MLEPLKTLLATATARIRGIPAEWRDWRDRRVLVKHQDRSIFLATLDHIRLPNPLGVKQRIVAHHVKERDAALASARGFSLQEWFAGPEASLWAEVGSWRRRKRRRAVAPATELAQIREAFAQAGHALTDDDFAAAVQCIGRRDAAGDWLAANPGDGSLRAFMVIVAAYSHSRAGYPDLLAYQELAARIGTRHFDPSIADACDDGFLPQPHQEARIRLVTVLCLVGEVAAARRIARQADGFFARALRFLSPLNAMPVAVHDGGEEESGETSSEGEDLLIIAEGMTPMATFTRYARAAGRTSFVCLENSSLLKADVGELRRVLPNDPALDVAAALTKYLPLYSEAEEELSRLSGAIAARTADFVRKLAQAAGLAPLEACADAISLPFDDLMFRTLQPVWATIVAARENRDRTIVLCCADVSMSEVLVQALATAEPGRTIVVLPSPAASYSRAALFHGETPDQAEAPFTVGGIAQEIRQLTAAGERVVQRRDRRVRPAYFVGRPLDRNYKLDIGHLARAAQRTRPTVLVTTASKLERGERAAEAFAASTGYDSWSAVNIAIEQTAKAEVTAPILSYGGVDAWHRHLDETGTPALYESAQSIADAAIHRYFTRVLPGFIRAIGAIDAEIRTNRPAYALLLPGRDWIARAFAVLARQQGVPTFDVQVVFVGPRSRYKIPLADYQFVLDTSAAAIFENFLHLDRSRILISGNARIGNEYAAARAKDRPGVRRRLGVQGGDAMIFFAASPLFDLCRPVVSALADALARRPGARLFVKLHPTADPAQVEAYEAIARQYGIRERTSVYAKEDVVDFVVAADLIVTRFSNVAMQAGLAGRDVITCNFEAVAPPIDLEKMGLSVTAASPAELERLIGDLLDHGDASARLIASRARYLEQNPQLLDSDIPGTMIRTVEEIAQRSASSKAAGTVPAA